jgi:hypothetical protein
MPVANIFNHDFHYGHSNYICDARWIAIKIIDKEAEPLETQLSEY